jgi:putative SOS response-associated peptidase YedK
MCGRFTLTATTEALNQLFPLFADLELEPRYNIAPSQPILAVRVRPGTQDLEAVRLRWGLVPSWAKDLKIGYKLINARADTAAEKPSFRSAFRQRHCLILADGFYEWKKLEAKKKQPYLFRLKSGLPFAFAGLWEKWTGPENVVESCTILTTDANDLTRPMHDRMPVMVEPGNYQNWLRTLGTGDPAQFDYLLPFPADAMKAEPVGTLVNDVYDTSIGDGPR